MMTFRRVLARQLIEQLNQLRGDPASWWSKLLAGQSTGVYIAIRAGCLNVYSAGASIARIEPGPERPQLRVHKKYLLLPPEGPAYVRLDGVRRHGQPFFITTQTEFAANIEAIRDNAARLSGEERAGANLIAARGPFIDLETTFSGRDADDLKRGQNGRVDLVGVDDSGTLVFCEAKLHSNSEPRSRRGLPPVCSQLRRYASWLSHHRESILTAYQVAFGIRQSLSGLKTVPEPQRIDLTPRLLVYGFDRSGRSALQRELSVVVAGVSDIGFGFNSITVIGSPSSFRTHHLNR